MSRTLTLRLAVILAGVPLCCLSFPGCQRGPRLLTVAEFADRQPTGVAVSGDDRVFISFPRWSPATDMSVAELLSDGTVRPFPDEQTNRWERGGDPKMRFVCVHSVYIDTLGFPNSLWVLDSGNPFFEGVVPNAPKLIRMDLSTNRIVRAIRFDSTIVSGQSYLNDVRVDQERGFAYITDSGLGALIVVNLNTNRSRRVLSDHPSVRSDPRVSPVVGSRPWPGSDGKVPQVHADGLAISSDKEHLYFKALNSKKLYGIPAGRLRNFSMPDSGLAEAVRSLGKAPVGGGMVADEFGDIYMAAIESDAVIRRKSDGTIETLISDPLLSWPNSLAISKEGDLYVTAPQIHLAARYNEGEDRRTDPYRILKLPGVVYRKKAKKNVWSVLSGSAKSDE